MKLISPKFVTHIEWNEFLGLIFNLTELFIFLKDGVCSITSIKFTKEGRNRNILKALKDNSSLKSVEFLITKQEDLYFAEMVLQILKSNENCNVESVYFECDNCVINEKYISVWNEITFPRIELRLISCKIEMDCSSFFKENSHLKSLLLQDVEENGEEIFLTVLKNSSIESLENNSLLPSDSFQKIFKVVEAYEWPRNLRNLKLSGIPNFFEDVLKLQSMLRDNITLDITLENCFGQPNLLSTMFEHRYSMQDLKKPSIVRMSLGHNNSHGCDTLDYMNRLTNLYVCHVDFGDLLLFLTRNNISMERLCELSVTYSSSDELPENEMDTILDYIIKTFSTRLQKIHFEFNAIPEILWKTFCSFVKIISVDIKENYNSELLSFLNIIRNSSSVVESLRVVSRRGNVLENIKPLESFLFENPNHTLKCLSLPCITDVDLISLLRHTKNLREIYVQYKFTNVYFNNRNVFFNKIFELLSLHSNLTNIKITLDSEVTERNYQESFCCHHERITFEYKSRKSLEGLKKNSSHERLFSNLNFLKEFEITCHYVKQGSISDSILCWLYPECDTFYYDENRIKLLISRNRVLENIRNRLL